MQDGLNGADAVESEFFWSVIVDEIMLWNHTRAAHFGTTRPTQPCSTYNLQEGDIRMSALGLGHWLCFETTDGSLKLMQLNSLIPSTSLVFTVYDDA